MNYLAVLPSELREELALYRDEVRIEVGISNELDDIRSEHVYSLEFTFGQTKSPLVYCTLDGLDRFLRSTYRNLGAFVNKPGTMHWLIWRDREMVIRTTDLCGRNYDLVNIPEDVVNIVLIKLKRIRRVLLEDPRHIVI